MKIPNYILDMHEYRKNIEGYIPSNKQRLSEEYKERIDNLIADLSFEELPDLGKVGDRVKECFNWVYENMGYNNFYKLATSLKEMEYKDKDDYAAGKGIVGEMFLNITLNAYFKKHNLLDKVKIYDSLIIDKHNGGTTEIDSIVVSSGHISVVEVKNYKGDKVLKEECTIKRKNDTKDIFAQNAMHVHSLYKLIKGGLIQDKGAMSSIFFNFGEGKVNDTRTEQNKKRMQYVDDKNIVSYLHTLSSFLDKENWNIEKVISILDGYVGKYSMEDHIKSLRG